MIKPAWLTVMIFSVQGLWNTKASNVIYTEQLKTLPNALGQIVAGGIARTGVGAAVTLFVMVVPLVMFVLSQSQVVQTMAHSGIKE
jgi:ABC-type glycerol-3-phosphate transport system permease component